MRHEPLMVGWDALRPERLQTGDIVHVQADNFVSRQIRRSERTPGERESWASHTEHVLRAATDGACDMSVNGGRPSIIPFGFWRDRASVLVTRLPEGLAPALQENFITHAAATLREARGYGWLKLAAHKADWILSQHPLARALRIRPVVFRRLCLIEALPICSYDTARRYWEVARVLFNNTGYPFVQPDDILDHCVHQAWPIVFADSAETFARFKRTYELAASIRQTVTEALA